jgi:hypothetical protein
VEVCASEARRIEDALAPREPGRAPEQGLVNLAGCVARESQPLFTEVGRDMARGPRQHTLPHGLYSVRTTTSPGGKVLWQGAHRIKNRAGHLFRLAAFSLQPSPTPLGNYLRRMKAKLGPKAATMATARQIAVIFYPRVKKQVEYDETLWASRDAQREKGGNKNQTASGTTGLRPRPSNPWLHKELRQRGCISWEGLPFTGCSATISLLR